jgi:hypothetical protein
MAVNQLSDNVLLIGCQNSGDSELGQNPATIRLGFCEHHNKVIMVYSQLRTRCFHANK